MKKETKNILGVSSLAFGLGFVTLWLLAFGFWLCGFLAFWLFGFWLFGFLAFGFWLLALWLWAMM